MKIVRGIMVGSVWCVCTIALPFFAASVRDCGNGYACIDNTMCVSTNSNAGRKFGCAPSPNAVVCADARFSCPEASHCNVMNDTCYTPSALAPLFENLDSHRLASKHTGGLCGIIADDLPARCNCTNHVVGGTVDCLITVLEHDKVGLQIDILPCGDPAYVDLQLTESTHHFNVTVASVEAGEEKDIPFPGLSVAIPHVGNIGVDASVLVDGNLDALQLKIGVNACAMVLGRKVCGSDLTKHLPIWILNGRHAFGSICKGGHSDIVV